MRCRCPCLFAGLLSVTNSRRGGDLPAADRAAAGAGLPVLFRGREAFASCPGRGCPVSRLCAGGGLTAPVSAKRLFAVSSGFPPFVTLGLFRRGPEAPGRRQESSTNGARPPGAYDACCGVCRGAWGVPGIRRRALRRCRVPATAQVPRRGMAPPPRVCGAPPRCTKCASRCPCAVVVCVPVRPGPGPGPGWGRGGGSVAPGGCWAMARNPPQAPLRSPASRVSIATRGN